MSDPERPDDDRVPFRLDLEAGEDINQWKERFFRSLPPHRFLLAEDGSLWYVPKSDPPRPVTSPDHLHGLASGVYRFFRNVKDREGNEREVLSNLTRQEARDLFNCHEPKAATLSTFVSILLEPAVGLDFAGNPFLFSRGYHPENGVFYQPPKGAPIEPRPGVEHLTRCFSGVPFAGPEYRANLMAWLLGALLFDPRIQSPLLVISGNQPGIGKTATMQACGAVLTGRPQSYCAARGEEFKKYLSAKYLSGQRFISFDNLVTKKGEPYSNSDLASFLTQPGSKEARILGQSRFISQTGVLFALTANNCRLDEDLTTRALSVKLFQEKTRPMDPYCLQYIADHRREVYGELLHLALSPPGQVSSDRAPFFRFPSWLAFVQPRIEPLFGKLALFEATELDEAVHDLLGWVSERGDIPFTAKELAAQFEHGETPGFRGLYARFGEITPRRLISTHLSKFINGLVGKSIRLVDGSTYTLERVSPATKTAPAVYKCSAQYAATEEECAVSNP